MTCYNFINQVKKMVEDFRIKNECDPNVIIIKDFIWEMLKETIVKQFSVVNIDEGIGIEFEIDITKIKICGLSLVVVSEGMYKFIDWDFTVGMLDSYYQRSDEDRRDDEYAESCENKMQD